MSVIYCLCPAFYWENFRNAHEYIPRDYEQEGFIHATKGDDLLIKVVNRVYKNFTDELLVLVIDEKNVTAEVRYEQAKDGNLYPHIYGPLNTNAIMEIKQMNRTKNGWTIG
ncbi:DUF952 domain-containing protein [Aneurinibacillus aneurinilyticus]|nr:DUF952 domain-containing protein [Aneurinibacillus aneurinilyticus]MCI1695368.1 DUF952 domain-containing protein [Aneurinibacillus aneurinilyticus]MED0670029.1 DUF952 domain-containing protein [Aneurinibacillus aneurinilyticus]MED0704854.1 DUF952 domain-containing protein [Aneurinibacillus aneurinilyticus]MED0723822.1 DUF952 domain-containing protein [Aneurinibacillus aneurinilyticus]MED0731105.1 DUF952 domain-containing protein [Aneurinibacillus aneurinilyticus]